VVGIITETDIVRRVLARGASVDTFVPVSFSAHR
jgi:CBS domain-containing protein